MTKVKLPPAKSTVGVANMLVPIGIVGAGVWMISRPDNTVGGSIAALAVITLGGLMAYKAV